MYVKIVSYGVKWVSSANQQAIEREKDKDLCCLITQGKEG